MLARKKEENLEMRIREMRKRRNTSRKPRNQQANPPAKRRKTGEETSSEVYTEWTARTETLEPPSSDKPPHRQEKTS